jgi:RNA polymerase sigma-70 factor, ECF subfamily
MIAPNGGYTGFKEETPGAVREQELTAAIQRGAPGAFHMLYEVYYRRVYNQVVYLIGDELQAQDVLQSIFLKVFGGLRGFRFRSSLTTWIYRIVHNECQDFNRRRGTLHVPLEAVLGSNDEMDSRPLSYDQRVCDERQEIIYQAVTQLPLKLREVVLLRYIEDLSYNEIGSVLGCSLGTVASRLSRALEELEERLRPFRRFL